ncbi:hypothetical protein [Aquimarina algiphila]|uniref:Uncharacterized protein n=1 Tax=Aquimarina algiphila TaxID=2047982 RepID=A0A554VRU1_9FLAO|nr:hypothetical protein [Aquimarina algiphila]TSE11356.1 hypothetical protein FOF46_01625 [Aquimarina algiphila]
MKFNFIILVSLMAISCHTSGQKKDTTRGIKIKWTENLEGDFSFRKNWSYKEGIYKNSFGQISCDWDCPPEVDNMKDKNGKILKDSLQVFYKIIDTIHVPYSLKSENRMYEYSGTNFIEFKKTEKNTITGQSINNVSTHSSLNLNIDNDNCSVWVDFNSIRDLGEHIFPLDSGTIIIDKIVFNQGIIKAVFDFKFKNTLEPEEKLFWKGLIYSEIKNK